MLKLKKTKRVLLTVAAIAAVATPLTIFAIHKVDSAEETFAVEGSDIATFEDPNFYECVLSNFREAFPNEAVSDDGLSIGQVRRIKRLICNGKDKPDSEKITSVRSASSDIDSREGGLEAMGYLEFLNLNNNKLTNLDVKYNGELTHLFAHHNNISTFSLGGLHKLLVLEMGDNQLSGSLDVSNNTDLTHLSAINNNLKSVTLPTNSNLKELFLQGNELEGNLDLSRNTGLEQLRLQGNALTSVNLSNNPNLIGLSVKDNNLALLDVSSCSSLEVLVAHGNRRMLSLDVSNNPNLQELSVDNILVTAGIEDESLTSGQKTFDLSNLKFISEDGNTTIPNTNYYTFNSSSKILSVTDIAKTGGFVLTAPIDSSIENSEYRRYKLQIAKIDSSAPTDDPTVDPTVDPTDDPTVDPTDDPTSDPADEGDDSDETIVPNTSGGDETGETGTGGKDAAGKPETGASTNDGKSGSSISISVLPIIIVALAILGVIGRKYISHKKINW